MSSVNSAVEVGGPNSDDVEMIFSENESRTDVASDESRTDVASGVTPLITDVTSDMMLLIIVPNVGAVPDGDGKIDKSRKIVVASKMEDGERRTDKLEVIKSDNGGGRGGGGMGGGGMTGVGVGDGENRASLDDKAKVKLVSDGEGEMDETSTKSIVEESVLDDTNTEVSSERDGEGGRDSVESCIGDEKDTNRDAI